MTFFLWPGSTPGRIGTGQLTVTSFAVPENSLGFWKQRLTENGISVEEVGSEFDEKALFFTDPDGLQLELIATPHANPNYAWTRSAVPVDFAIRGFHHVTLSESGYERTASLLTDTLGFKPVQQQGARFRYAASTGLPGTVVDLICAPEGRPDRVAAGTVHHVAWRTATDEQQVQWRETLSSLQFNVTPVIDRTYFHSIYFREPGGVLFEIATDLPGFLTDETFEALGTELRLPPWYEPYRSRISAALPAIKMSPPIIGGGGGRPTKLALA